MAFRLFDREGGNLLCNVQADGACAALEGCPLSDNPFGVATRSYRIWRDAWLGQRERMT